MAWSCMIEIQYVPVTYLSVVAAVFQMVGMTCALTLEWHLPVAPVVNPLHLLSIRSLIREVLGD